MWRGTSHLNNSSPRRRNDGQDVPVGARWSFDGGNRWTLCNGAERGDSGIDGDEAVAGRGEHTSGEIGVRWRSFDGVSRGSDAFLCRLYVVRRLSLRGDALVVGPAHSLLALWSSGDRGALWA